MTRHQFVEPHQNWTACIAPHAKDPDRPRRASHGLLCAGHHANLEQSLAELPAMLTDVESALVRYGNGLTPRVSGTRDQPLPYATDKDGESPPGQALRAVHAILASWCLLVLEEHPSSLHTPQDASQAMSTFLLRHLDWCTAQPWVDDLLRETREITSQLRRAALPSSGMHRKTLGDCKTPLACDVATHLEQVCAGTLFARVSREDTGLLPDIECTGCDYRHSPETWRALKRRLCGDESWLTSSQLSALWSVPLGSVWRWAHEDTWRRLDRRPKRYHLDDAQRSFDTRRLETT